MELTSWFALLAICCLGAMSPGPSLAMVVRHTLASGRLHGIVCAWAHAMGIGFYALVTLLGLAALLQSAPMVFNGIAVIGGLYLIWLGIQALRATAGADKKYQAGQQTSLLKAAADGLAISLFNPKILLFFIALFSQFVLSAQSLLGQGLVVFTPLVIDGLWYTVIATLLSHQAVLPKIKQHAQLIDKISGIVLLFLGAKVIVGIAF